MAHKATPITSLKLKEEPIPADLFYFHLDRTGRPPRCHRHYLAGEPVHCGDLLEVRDGNRWRLGRYEWTCEIEDQPTLQIDDNTTLLLGPQHLLRWPTEHC